MSQLFYVPKAWENAWLVPLRILFAIFRIFWLVVRLVLQPVSYTLSRPMRPVMDILNLASAWAGDTPSKKWIILGVVSLLISYVSIGMFATPATSIAILAFVGFHELLHGYGYFRAKIPFYIVFIGFLGAAAVTADTNFHKMKQYDKSIMLLLGPIGSLIAGLVCFALAAIFPEYYNINMMLAGFNLTLVLFNVVALGALDGGRIYLSLMESLRERDEKFVAIPLLVVSVITLVAVFLHSFRFELILFFLFLMAVGFIKTAGKDNPAKAYSDLAMTNSEILKIVFAYLALIVIGAVLYPYFPDWSGMFTIHPFISENLVYIIIVVLMLTVVAVSTEIMFKLQKLGFPRLASIIQMLFVFVGGFLTLYYFHAVQNLPFVNVFVSFLIGGSLGALSHVVFVNWQKTYKKIMENRPVEVIPTEGLMPSED